MCVVGENGLGESVLIKGLLRLKFALSGEIRIGDGLKASEIGYLPQQTAAQKNFPAGVFEMVLSRAPKQTDAPPATRSNKWITKGSAPRSGGAAAPLLFKS